MFEEDYQSALQQENQKQISWKTGDQSFQGQRTTSNTNSKNGGLIQFNLMMINNLIIAFNQGKSSLREPNERINTCDILSEWLRYRGEIC